MWISIQIQVISEHGRYLLSVVRSVRLGSFSSFCSAACTGASIGTQTVLQRAMLDDMRLGPYRLCSATFWQLLQLLATFRQQMSNLRYKHINELKFCSCLRLKYCIRVNQAPVYTQYEFMCAHKQASSY